MAVCRLCDIKCFSKQGIERGCCINFRGLVYWFTESSGNCFCRPWEIVENIALPTAPSWRLVRSVQDDVSSRALLLVWFLALIGERKARWFVAVSIHVPNSIDATCLARFSRVGFFTDYPMLAFMTWRASSLSAQCQCLQFVWVREQSFVMQSSVWDFPSHGRNIEQSMKLYAYFWLILLCHAVSWGWIAAAISLKMIALIAPCLKRVMFLVLGGQQDPGGHGCYSSSRHVFC